MAWESPSDEDSELITHAHRDVYGDADWINPFQLSEPLQTCWAVENAQGIIDNGGLQYFFDSDWDGNPPYSFFIDAYRRIGAGEAADCLTDAVAQFAFSEPHLYSEQRRKYLLSSRSSPDADDSIIDRLGSRMIDFSGDAFTKLAAYIRVNIQLFPQAKAYLLKKE